MKILHVGDQAGVAAVMANICTKLGHDSIVLQDDNIDTFRIGEFYSNTEYFKSIKDIKKRVEKIGSNFDHIIYHDQLELASQLDNLHISSSYVFHGNLLRQKPQLYGFMRELESVDNVFVTTADMFAYAPEALPFPRPVDRELFTKDEMCRKYETGLCLTQQRYFEYIKDLIRGRVDLGIFLVDRVINRIAYNEMPKVLNGYRGYYDFKFQPTHPPTLIPEASLTGLQALACGVPMFSNNTWYNVFPEMHDDEVAARALLKHIM